MAKTMPVDDRLFKQLGEKFKVSTAAAKRLYYARDLNTTGDPMRFAIKTVEDTLRGDARWMRAASSQKTRKY